VTVFNRGNHAPPAGVTALLGDRTTPAGLEALRHGEWDFVVDTWSDAPTAVRDAARVLATQSGRYAYISSRSVYPMPTKAQLAEDSPLVDGSPDAEEAEYPQAKRGGELAAEAAFGDRALLVRAGMILGPHENVGRLPWWLTRIARGGAVLAPGPRDLPLQYVDARDLATWTLDALEKGLGGAYNLVSEPGHTTMGELLAACVRTTGSDARLRWLDAKTVLDAGIEPWIQLPIWLPPGELHETLHQGNVSKAMAAGLRCRPIEETVSDTWDWLRQLTGFTPDRSGGRRELGLDPDVEAKLLAEH
jgi:nucleoside-diphosphate-sugar epimerase